LSPHQTVGGTQSYGSHPTLSYVLGYLEVQLILCPIAPIIDKAPYGL